MSGLLRFLLLLLLSYVPHTSANTADHEETPARNFVQEMIVRAHQRLTTGLYKVFARKDSGNLLLSPWSVMSLLTVTYMVASGRTASEIGDHLNINLLRRKEILAGFEHINDVFKNAENGSSEELESINGAFVGDSVNPNHRLQRVLQQNLNAYIDHIITAANDDDRSHNNKAWRPGDAFREVLMEKSHGQIQSLLPADGVSVSKMELWLFNVMYFQGSWQSPFHPHLTHVARFMAGGKHPVPVVTMTTKASFPRSYYPDLQMTLLELPYGQAGRYGLFVLLPDRQDGLPMLEKRLRHFSLESMLSESHWVRTAKVYLPKFKFQADVNLMDAMKKLGFKRMFSPKEADFSRLEPKTKPKTQTKMKKTVLNSPHVSSMVQRSIIEVNENGTTAAAATALRLSSRRHVDYFRVNHPFMFVLRDKRMGINLFVGRVIDPRLLS